MYICHSIQIGATLSTSTETAAFKGVSHHMRQFAHGLENILVKNFYRENP